MARSETLCHFLIVNIDDIPERWPDRSDLGLVRQLGGISVPFHRRAVCRWPMMQKPSEEDTFITWSSRWTQAVQLPAKTSENPRRMPHTSPVGE